MLLKESRYPNKRQVNHSNEIMYKIWFFMTFPFLLNKADFMSFWAGKDVKIYKITWSPRERRITDQRAFSQTQSLDCCGVLSVSTSRMKGHWVTKICTQSLSLFTTACQHIHWSQWGVSGSLFVTSLPSQTPWEKLTVNSHRGYTKCS